jgi:hypothetical protein
VSPSVPFVPDAENVTPGWAQCQARGNIGLMDDAAEYHRLTAAIDEHRQAQAEIAQRRTALVRRMLDHKTQREVAADLGVSRARIAQLAARQAADPR